MHDADNRARTVYVEKLRPAIQIDYILLSEEYPTHRYSLCAKTMSPADINVVDE